MSICRSRTGLFIAGLVSILLSVSCGGGGGSGSSITPLTYSGNSAPAVITLDNATTLVANVLYAGESSSSLPLRAIDTGITAESMPNVYRSDYIDALIATITDGLEYRIVTGSEIQYRIDIDKPLFCQSGSASLTGSLDETTGTGTLVLTYNSCMVDGFMFDGTASLIINQFDFGYLMPTVSTMDITLMTVSGFGFNGSMSGTIDLLLQPWNNTDIVILNYVTRDNITARMYRYENVLVTTVYDNYMQPTSGTESWSGMPGRGYDSIWGYVDIATPVAMSYSSILNTYPDMDGVMILTGAADSHIRVTVLSADTIQLELDIDGAGGYEQSRILSWDDLALDANTNLATIDEAEVLRVPLANQTLTGFTSDNYIGQTFRLPQAAALQQLTVYLESPSGIDFHLLLVEIDSDPVPHPTLVLFESQAITAPPTVGLTPIDVNLAGTPVNGGQTYAWILDGYVAYNGTSQYALIAINWPDPYPDGSYIHSDTFITHTTTREENFADWWYEDTHQDMSFILEHTTD